MENITLSNLQTAILVMLGIMAVLVSIDKGIEAYKRLFVKKGEDTIRNINTKIDDLHVRVTSCEQRLNKGDSKFASIEEDNKQMLLVLNAMLMHMISGNDHAKLSAVKESLDQYLALRR